MQKLSYLTNAMADKRDGVNLESALRGVYNRLSTQSFNSGAIAQDSSNTTNLKTAAAIHGIVNGVPITKAATADVFVPVAGQVVAIGKTNVMALFLDAAGTGTCVLGTPGTTVSNTGLNGAKFPPIPEGKMMIGFVILTGGVTAWTGGTSTFTTSTTDYYCTIVNTVGAFDPTATI